MIEEQIRDLLRGVAAIRNRVDQGPTKPGIYASTVPASHRGEAIVLQCVGTTRIYDLDGEAGVCESSLDVTCYAANAKRAKTLADLVRNRLSGYHGEVGDADPIDIYEAIIGNEPGATQEPPADASDHWFYSYITEYSITHETSIPTFT